MNRGCTPHCAARRRDALIVESFRDPIRRHARQRVVCDASSCRVRLRVMFELAFGCATQTEWRRTGLPDTLCASVSPCSTDTLAQLVGFLFCDLATNDESETLSAFARVCAVIAKNAPTRALVTLQQLCDVFSSATLCAIERPHEQSVESLAAVEIVESFLPDRARLPGVIARAGALALCVHLDDFEAETVRQLATVGLLLTL